MGWIASDMSLAARGGREQGRKSSICHWHHPLHPHLGRPLYDVSGVVGVPCTHFVWNSLNSQYLAYCTRTSPFVLTTSPSVWEIIKVCVPALCRVPTRAGAQLSEFGPPNEGADDAMMVKVCGQVRMLLKSKLARSPMSSPQLTTEEKSKKENLRSNPVTETECHQKVSLKRINESR